MNLKDIIHHHIGCQFEIDGEREVLTIDWLWKIDRTNAYDRVKLVLRPYKHLLIDEVLDYHDTNYPDYANCSITHKLNFMGSLCYGPDYKPEIFKWLLLKGVDLFNLASQNLAIYDTQ